MVETIIENIRTFSVGSNDSDFPVSRYGTISHAINAALPLGNVSIEPGLNDIPSVGSVTIKPISNRTIGGAGMDKTIIRTARSDYIFKNDINQGINDFVIEDIGFDCQDLPIVSVAKFYKATRVGMLRCRFTRSNQWFVVFGNEPSATSIDRNYDCFLDSCLFDTHSSIYEMALVYNSVGTVIKDCIFRKNSTNSPTLGLWQLTDKTTIENCHFYDCRDKPIYYSQTSNDTVIRGCYFNNCGSSIVGGNASDNGLFNKTYAHNLKVFNCYFLGGINSVRATAIQFGGVDGCYAFDNTIENYESGIKYSEGNNTGSIVVSHPSKNGFTYNNTFKNMNPMDNFYALHTPLIFVDGAGSGMDVHNNRIIDSNVKATLKYGISFNTRGHNYDNIYIHDNDFSGVKLPGGSDFSLNDGVTLVSNGANWRTY